MGITTNTTDEFRITINKHKGRTHHKKEDRSHRNKKLHVSSGMVKSCESLSDGNKGLHLIINEKIDAAFSFQEKKDLNNFETLSIFSGSNDGNNSNSNSRISNTSDKDTKLE
eukprot:13665598-Ditylum_brightwellii.AAC.1